uniref:Uncharacterized protein n=1 Tax=Rhizophora mucronata TaxID=61149 RepID=A0A2P2KXP7_RHIMU
MLAYGFSNTHRTAIMSTMALASSQSDNKINSVEIRNYNEETELKPEDLRSDTEMTKLRTPNLKTKIRNILSKISNIKMQMQIDVGIEKERENTNLTRTIKQIRYSTRFWREF